MEYLYRIGLTEEEIRNLVEINNDILNMSDKEIESLVILLEIVGCNRNQITNILIANPFYLNRSITDIKNLICKLTSLGITNLEITFDSNPYLLNKDTFEIDDYIEEQKLLGLDVDDIISNIDSGFID